MAPSSNAQREMELMDCFKNVPQFEAMMSTLRLGQRAQSQLPKDQYDQYLQFAAKAGACLYSERGGIPFPWNPEAEEIQMQVSRAFSDYPEAVSNFRQFVRYGHEALARQSS
ncbi:hypothetical protein NCS57_00352700 [Fusarium keratoplasticum]|uniref:Uncharacterized protein n=1 Tax=Fusarium keratoplasticum TaxID=1328300 RepID=A0ACC0R4H8_9HYPO|nr:hypothetical protein NCS57_00352700 [Fusarium keratoplasticum]KAI8674547.1 hypothetical protein NCS57_00352700 [Fusarium keratoplasticum]